MSGSARQYVFAAALTGTVMLTGTAHAEPVGLDDMLREMKSALLKVEKKAPAGLPKLKSATLNVTTTHKSSAGATFKLLIIEFGAKKTSELTTAVSIVLTPPGKAAPEEVSPDISEVLSEAILAAARSVEAAKSGAPPLIVSELKASIKFGVSKDASGKVKFEFLPLTPGAEGGGSRADIQEIVLIYKD